MDPKVIITGTGRAGTSWLMGLFTWLGFDTGYTREDLVDNIKFPQAAGLEFSNSDNSISGDADDIREHFNAAPRFLKTPDYHKYLPMFVRDELVNVEWVLIPIRDNLEVTKSRLAAGLEYNIFLPNKQCDFQTQYFTHYVMLAQIVEACVLYRIPHTFLRFPDFIDNEKYLFGTLLASVREMEDKAYSEKFFEVWRGFSQWWESNVQQA